MGRGVRGKEEEEEEGEGEIWRLGLGEEGGLGIEVEVAVELAVEVASDSGSDSGNSSSSSRLILTCLALPCTNTRLPLTSTE